MCAMVIATQYRSLCRRQTDTSPYQIVLLRAICRPLSYAMLGEYLISYRRTLYILFYMIYMNNYCHAFDIPRVHTPFSAPYVYYKRIICIFDDN